MDPTRRMRAAIAASGLLMPAGEALALLDDRLELFAAENVTHDDNVFRLSRGVDPAATLGTATKGDTFRTTEYGFNLNLPVSLQRFEAGVTRRLTHHERFTALDLNGYEDRIIWNWQVADRANGQLGQTRSRTLASFTNVQGGAQSTTPNFLTTRRSFGNAAYDVTARWQIRGELDRIEQSNSAGERLANDVTIDAAGLTLSYTTPPGNAVGTTLRVVHGDLPHPLGFAAGTEVDNSYRQRSLVVFTQWRPTEPSHLKARLGRVQRTHKELPQRNFEGPILGLTYEWKPSELLTFNVAAQRDISAVEEINVGFVRVKGIELQAVWRPTEKLGFGARIESNSRDYLGDPSVALGVASPRAEHIRATAVLMDYRPTRSVTINLAWRRERRSANVALGDYEFDAVSVGIRVAF